MTREEYYAGIEAYKNKLEHRAMDANAEDTAGKALENWKNQYLNQAVNLRAKQYLASKSGRTDDASTYEKQLQILLDKMTNLKGVSLSAKQALLQTIDQTATNKANVQFAKHSDEPEDGVLEHGSWKDHKYIRIENGRYIYPEDLESKKLREDAANQRNVSKGMQEIAAFDKYLLNNGKNSDGSPVKKDKELSKELQKDYDQSMAWSAATQAQEKGMLRKAEDLKAQADKKRFDAAAANTAKVNEERKEKAVNNNNQSVQTARSQSDESAAKAQREGEAMQAWKDQQAAKQKEYEDDIKNLAIVTINAWAANEDITSDKGKYGSEGHKLAEKILDSNMDKDTDKIENDYTNAIYKEYLKRRDSLSPEVRTRIEEALSSVGAQYRPKKVTHSLNLTREEYYAGIEEYKRKKA